MPLAKADDSPSHLGSSHPRGFQVRQFQHHQKAKKRNITYNVSGVVFPIRAPCPSLIDPGMAGFSVERIEGFASHEEWRQAMRR